MDFPALPRDPDRLAPLLTEREAERETLLLVDEPSEDEESEDESEELPESSWLCFSCSRSFARTFPSSLEMVLLAFFFLDFLELTLLALEEPMVEVA